MISASRITFSHYSLKILRPKVRKNLTNLHKKFCEFPPRSIYYTKSVFQMFLIFAKQDPKSLAKTPLFNDPYEHFHCSSIIISFSTSHEYLLMTLMHFFVYLNVLHFLNTATQLLFSVKKDKNKQI